MHIIIAFSLILSSLAAEPTTPSILETPHVDISVFSANEAEPPALSTRSGAVVQQERTFLRGTVYDAATRTPLSAASVVLTARNRIVATDQEGNFRLETTGVPFPLKLRITFVGFEEKHKSVTPRDTVRGLSVYLEAKTVELGPITVISHIRLTDVEQVEIHHGPHALQFGPSFGGTINLVRVEPGPFDQRGWQGDLTAGLALSVSGAVPQSILRNPLASPFTLGISGAAVFGAAFAWSMASTLLILGIARYRGTTPEIMVLSGIAIGSLFGAGVSAMQYLATEVELATIVFWMFGD